MTPSLSMRSLRYAALSLCLALAGAVKAQTAFVEGVQDLNALHATAERFADDLGNSRAQSIGGIAKSSVGQPDARLKLAACPDLQAYLPPGARQSGRTIIGVRCVGGRAWQIFLPADIHVEAPVWVSTQVLPAGHVLNADDITQRNMEVATTEGENHTLTASDAPPFGQTLARGIGPNMPLRASDLHDPSRITPGDPVQVIYAGTGFTVQGDGKAIGVASPGQSVQVRMAGGSVVSGVLQQDHVVKIDL